MRVGRSVREAFVSQRCSVVARAAAVAAVALLSAETPAAAQEPGRVVGRVVEEGSGRPLAQVQVYLVGTDIGTLTGENGRFVLLNVPPGEYSLEMQLIGFETATQPVVLAAGGPRRSKRRWRRRHSRSTRWS